MILSILKFVYKKETTGKLRLMKKLIEEDLRLTIFRLSSGWGKTEQLKIFCKTTGMLIPHIISKPFKHCKFKFAFHSDCSGFICSLAETEKQQIDGKRNSTEHIQKEGQ